MADTDQRTKKYRGNCHCGAFVFEFEAPEIKSGVICNCSICYKKGYFAITPGVELKVVKDEGTITQYQFGEKKWKHQFCSKCGTATFGTSDFFDPPMNMGINARCIQNLDIWSLQEQHVDSTNLPPPYTPHLHPGPPPSPSNIPSDKGKLYHLTCHCGAVTASLKVDHPFDSKEYTGTIAECNCSHCIRGGYIWSYPTATQLSLSGAQNLTWYTFNNKIIRKGTCKHCGVLLLAEPVPIVDGEEPISDEMKTFRESFKDIRPVNLRAVNQDELDVEDLRAKGRVRQVRRDGGEGGVYINP
ncbi:Mss4-like protein [Cercophora samala]|uniref:Mss4-like protein n=1 Tax=Cercophora samala TaxID=330535 RepID=A0AA39Z8C7_9PEZI|nr:Mss4-like protein [Cercophora samala]